MIAFPNRLVALALLAAAGAGACAIAAQPSSSESGVFVRAAQKPNGSGVDVRYRLLDTPAVGQSVRVEIVLGKIGDSGATLELAADPGLRLHSAASAVLPAGETTTLTISVEPQKEGLAYLNVFTRQRGATSATAIAIQTGPATAGSKKAGANRLKDGSDGDKILSMPVK